MPAHITILIILSGQDSHLLFTYLILFAFSTPTLSLMETNNSNVFNTYHFLFTIEKCDCQICALDLHKIIFRYIVIYLCYIVLHIIYHT